MGGRKLANWPPDWPAVQRLSLMDGSEEAIKNACKPMKVVGESLQTHHTRRLSRKPAADQSSAHSQSPPVG